MRAPAIRSFAVALAGAALVGVAACGGDDSSSSSGGYSVADGLEQLPESTLEDGYLIQTADLDRASELAGLARPDPDADADDLADWAIQITGFRGDGDDVAIVAAVLPQAANPQQLYDVDDFRDEAGWSIAEVDSYIEVNLPPDRFTVLEGEFDTDALDDALGDADDGIWSLGDGDDYDIDITERSPARPLGETLRIAEQDGHLAVSKSTDQIEDWLEGDGDTAADDDDLRAVGEALDDQDVYSAMILDGEDLTVGGPGLTPEQLDEIDDLALDEFEALGVGLTMEDDEPRAVFVYQYDDEAAAEDAAEQLEDIFEDGTSLRTATPISDYFTDVEITVDGSTVTAVAEFARDSPAARIWNFAFSRDLITAHR